MNIIRELEKLSLTTDFMTEQQATQVSDLVLTILKKVSPPHIVDVMWKRAIQGGMQLEPLLYACRHTTRGQPKPYVLTEAPAGLWGWVYHHEKHAWVRDVKRAGPGAALRNEATGDLLEPHHLNIFHETDSVMVVPLKVENVVYGLYSVEWPVSEGLTAQTLKLLQDLAVSLALICWKVETTKINQQQTTQAITLFGDAIQTNAATVTLSRQRTGFFARPFTRQFDVIDNYVRAYLREKGIEVQRYKHTQGHGVVVEEILKQIEASHFGVVEVTGSNPNVLMELGALRALKKPTLILRRADDESELPFDLRPFYHVQYAVKGRRFVWCRDTEEVPLDTALDDLVRTLQADPSFVAADALTPPPRDPEPATGVTGHGGARPHHGRNRVRESVGEDLQARGRSRRGRDTSSSV
jgi:hypothetical protein